MAVNIHAQGNTSGPHIIGDYFGNATYKQKKIPRHIQALDGWNLIDNATSGDITQVQKWRQ